MAETLRSDIARAAPVETVRVSVQRPMPATPVEGESVTVGSADGNRVVVAVPSVSRYHLEATATPRGIRIHDLGSTNGTFIGSTRIETAYVKPGTVITCGDAALLVESGAGTEIELHDGAGFHGLVGRSAPMRRLFSQIERAAAAPVAVLLSGESGTGKEVVAEAIHRASPRAAGPFVVVDCGALVPTLVASELFGHERGAFTGADRQHVGAFERAQGGTLLLDEIGELPAAVQPALLGALERRKIRRVGAKVDIPIDVRVISATHRDLREEVNAGNFRLDLFYRLAVVVLMVPPLRERAGDLPLLVEHFARAAGYGGALHELISQDALATLSRGRFEGNLRELRNMVEALLAMGELPPALPSAPGAQDNVFAHADGLPYKQARALVLRAFEAHYVAELLSRTSGNVAAAARMAGMDRSYLTELIAKQKR